MVQLVSPVQLTAGLAIRFRGIGIAGEQDPGTPSDAVESTRRAIESFVEQLSSLETQITEAQSALWGSPVEDESDG
jgi:hypothetical protein